jgi:hypothetical protein
VLKPLEQSPYLSLAISQKWDCGGARSDAGSFGDDARRQSRTQYDSSQKEARANPQDRGKTRAR